MRSLCLLFCCLICFFTSEASASKKAMVSFVTVDEKSPDSNSLFIGIQFDLQKGWHTYWRSPGPVGFPVRLDWSGSKNLDSVEVFWPAPVWFHYSGIASVGYRDQVVLPVKIRLKDSSQKTTLSLKANYLVCSDSKCIPEENALSLVVDGDFLGSKQGIESRLGLLKSVPEFTPSPFLGIMLGFTIDQSASGYDKISLTATHQKGFTKPRFFLEGPYKFYIDPPSVYFSSDRKKARVEFYLFKNELKKEKANVPFAMTTFQVTIADGDDFKSETVSLKKAGLTLETLLMIIGSALLGGFILNFMPCVLPVLSLKFFSIMKSPKEDIQHIRKEFVLTILGILTSFLIFACLAIFIKTIGLQVGWGMQFQQPAFLIGISFILLLFTANLWGFFDVKMPLVMSRISSPLGGLSKKYEPFLMGAFVTLLATPCTAPFLGTAISFSLSRGPVEIISIFLIMGIGLALPYILVAAWPRLARLLPRPGAWMETLRSVLGFFVFATFIWVLSILFAQYGLSLKSLVIVIALYSFLLIFLKISSLKYLRSLSWILLLGGTLSLGVLSSGEVVQRQSEGDWKPLNVTQIESFVKQGKTVFVDITADWCLTCKVNEAAVLNTIRAEDLFKKNHIILMKGDWTSPNPKITQFLQSYNEYAIPFYIVYGPAAPEGLKLPQLLTFGLVEKALQTASGNAR